MSVYIGADIGGTKFLVASCNHDGTVLSQSKAPTPVDLQEGLDLLNKLIRQVSEGEHIDGIGAAIGGPLDHTTGVVSPLHQPQWRNIPLKGIMEEKWGCPFNVDVDTNIAALGEYKAADRRYERFVYLTISTGVGGGVLIDGKIFRGTTGGHPEVGHQAIPFRCAHPDRVHCECGIPDCLEALVSGNAIQRIYQKPAEDLSPAEWDEVAYNLGQGLRNIAVFYAPDIIIIGGGVAIGGGKTFIENAQNVMRSKITIVPAPPVRLPFVGYNSVLAGAMEAARHGIISM